MTNFRYSGHFQVCPDAAFIVINAAPDTARKACYLPGSWLLHDGVGDVLADLIIVRERGTDFAGVKGLDSIGR